MCVKVKISSVFCVCVVSTTDNHSIYILDELYNNIKVNSLFVPCYIVYYYSVKVIGKNIALVLWTLIAIGAAAAFASDLLQKRNTSVTNMSLKCMLNYFECGLGRWRSRIRRGNLWREKKRIFMLKCSQLTVSYRNRQKCVLFTDGWKMKLIVVI